ncbi:MAG TPA: DUF3500 domain-containing protein [Lacipirellulaceae bacterium]|jgi:hypothetical protein|nr:DUF3500 domain-containing protein [Lacipirellulaceae bacterium]
MNHRAQQNSASVSPLKQPACDRCQDTPGERRLQRREFFAASGVVLGAAAIGGILPARVWAEAKEAEKAIAASSGASSAAPESMVKVLYDTLSPKQRETMCFDWAYQDPDRGLLRTRVANNWEITKQAVSSDFYTKDQQHIIREIFEGIINPEWHSRIDKQLADDSEGYGTHNSIAIFGHPGSDKFEFVMTGRHMTIRCDGHSADHVAFGGPIFYGHAADGQFNETATHPGNVFWPQAQAANKLYEMLDGKQQKQSLITSALPKEQNVGFRGEKGDFVGLPVSDLSSDQKEHLQKVMAMLVEPYRQSDRDEVTKCLKTQGGLENCHLAYYSQSDIGKDGVWDVWRLEGPAFVWYYRGAPHVHVWVNVADDPSVKLNA